MDRIQFLQNILGDEGYYCIAGFKGKEKIHKFGHMHLDDLLARRDRFRNEVVIASHFSTRYTDDRIRRILAKRIPDMLDGRLQVWL